ncbi:MAG TPA: ornithine cyclodeaminase family protein [Candidatus Limnocylindria bacterium]|nr:ornithine cyclodeaminase family protein [Candidatus Limnocylindria bacterium]
MLVLSRSDVERLLDPDLLRAGVARAMADLSAGRASMPARIAANVPEHDGLLAAMPAYLPSSAALTTKLVSLFPRNTDRPTHQAVILVFDAKHGTPVALMDGEAITAARTAAASALATDLLARRDASVLAIVGTGVQARSHLRAVPRVRDFREVRIAGRHAENAAALLAEAREWLPRANVRVADSYAQAEDGADVICAATHSPEPVVRREWIAPGTHVTSVGYNTAGREVDAATFRDALLVVESRAAALAPPPAGSNDIAMAIAEGAITREHVHAELGELVAGTRPGRATAEQITLYKSVGVAVQDAAAAAMVLEAALRARAGREVEI